MIGDNNIIIENNFAQQYHHVVGKNIFLFSFTPDEANVDDLAKACG